MAWPFAGLLVGTGVGFALQPLAPWFHATFVPNYDPDERNKLYFANYRRPNLALGLGDCFEVYYRGECDLNELGEYIRFQGANLQPNDESYLNAKWWDKHRIVLTPQIPVDIALRAFSIGLISDSKLDDVIRLNGFRYDTDRKVIKADSLSLDLAFILQLFDRGLIDQNAMIAALQHAGYRAPFVLDLIKKQSTGIDPQISLMLWNRGIITQDDVTKFQKWGGIRDTKVQELSRELRWQWPALSEVTRWAQSGSFNEDYINNQKLDDEQPDEYIQLARAAGAKWDAFGDVPKNWPKPEVSTADYAWRAHWRPNDIATAIEMKRRLRPSAADPSMSRYPGVPAYTDDDFNRDLQINAIPPGRRDQFKAITYSLPRFTIWRQALQSGAATADEIVDRLQDQGYDVATAKTLVDTWEHLLYQKQVDKLRPISIENVKMAYRIGTMDRQTAAINLQIIFLNDYEKVSQFIGSDYTTQSGAANANPWVNMALALIDSDIHAELLKQAIEVTHKALLRLEITATQAIADLVGLGINYNRAAQYVQLWTYEQATEGVEVRAAQLADWYVNQLIDQDTFRTRLLMLGYTRGDAALTIARAQIKINAAIQRVQTATQKAKNLQAKQLAAAAQALLRQQSAIKKAICRSATRVQVVSFYISGYVTRDDAKSRLIECGMSESDAEDMIKTAEGKQSAKQAKTAAKSNGTAAAPTPPVLASVPVGTTTNPATQR